MIGAVAHYPVAYDWRRLFFCVIIVLRPVTLRLFSLVPTWRLSCPRLLGDYVYEILHALVSGVCT